METCCVCKNRFNDCRIKAVQRYKDTVYRYYWCKKCSSNFYTSDKNRKYRLTLVREYNSKNPLKYRARYTLRNAVAIGTIKKPKQCVKCYSNERIEAHHADHSKPLEVMWLCKECHRKAHKHMI